MTDGLTRNKRKAWEGTASAVGSLFLDKEATWRVSNRKKSHLVFLHVPTREVTMPMTSGSSPCTIIRVGRSARNATAAQKNRATRLKRA